MRCPVPSPWLRCSSRDWYAYADLTVRRQIEDAEQRLEDDRWEAIEIRRLQRFYEIESKKIESAIPRCETRSSSSGFVSALGRRLPERMVIDTIELNDGRFIIRGRLGRPRSAPASSLATTSTSLGPTRRSA